jgi:hypothetical protein
MRARLEQAETDRPSPDGRTRTGHTLGRAVPEGGGWDGLGVQEVGFSQK